MMVSVENEFNDEQVLIVHRISLENADALRMQRASRQVKLSLQILIQEVRKTRRTDISCTYMKDSPHRLSTATAQARPTDHQDIIYLQFSELLSFLQGYLDKGPKLHFVCPWGGVPPSIKIQFESNSNPRLSRT